MKRFRCFYCHVFVFCCCVDERPHSLIYPDAKAETFTEDRTVSYLPSQTRQMNQIIPDSRRPSATPSCSRGTRAASVGQMANRTPLMHSGSSHSPGETWTPSGRSFPPTVEPLSASERRERVAETEQPDSGELTFVSVSPLTPQVTSHDRTRWGHLRPNTR